MRSLLDMDTIQIEITNACINQCANCTRLVGHFKTPFFMELDFFKKAVDSLVDFPKMVGVMGGEPLLHPQFEEMSLYLHSNFPRERCGLWTTLPRGKEHLAPLIANVYGNVLLNDHSVENLYHMPILVAGNEYIPDKFTMWYLIDKCWVQNTWSASITPKGAFFCEVAAALDTVFEGPGGWPVEKDWWKKTPKDYREQMERYCVTCGAPFPWRARLDSDDVDDVSPQNLKRLQELKSPKAMEGGCHVYQEGFCRPDKEINDFRKNADYFNKIAAKYNMGLETNKQGYLSPFLKSASKATEQSGVGSRTNHKE